VAHVVEEQVYEGEIFKALVLRFPNGSSVTGLPANPRTARGVHGNLVLDEFAHHQDPREIWIAVSPVVTRGYRIIVLSTPRGKGGKFYELWEHGGDIWNRHKTDIYEAVEQGLKVDIDELKKVINDPDAWAQEYETKFVDEAHAWIPYDLIDAAEDRGASLVMAAGFVPVGPLYLGIDIGRTRGLTVFNLNEKIGDVHWTRHLQRLKGVPISDQIVAARPLARQARRTCIDKGVFGLAIFEALEKELGPSRVEGVQLNAKVKEDLAVKLKQAYEDHRLRTPVDPELRLAVHAVKRVTTIAGNVRFDAEVSDAGHADEFWAQALALMAAETSAAPFAYERVTTRPAASAFRRTRFDARSILGLDEDDEDDDEEALG
jgi:phage FluMu gp28-like protein